MTRKQRRAILIGTCLGVLALAVGLVLFTLRDSIVFFYTPSEAAEKGLSTGQRFRLGGLVEDGSVKRSEGTTVSFVITDKRYATPRGELASDPALVRALDRRLPWIRREEIRHREALSLELAAAVLQHLYDGACPPVLPVLCGPGAIELDDGGPVESFLATMEHVLEDRRVLWLVTAELGHEEALANAPKKELYAEYAAFTEALAKAGAGFSAGERLAPSDTATTVRARGGESTVLDGPYADTKEQLAGYYLIDVPDLDEAIAWAKRCPSSKYGAIEIRPLWQGQPRT